MSAVVGRTPPGTGDSISVLGEPTESTFMLALGPWTLDVVVRSLPLLVIVDRESIVIIPIYEQRDHGAKLYRESHG